MQHITAYRMKRLALLIGVASSALALSACQPKADDPSVGQRVDGAIGTAEQGVDRAKAGMGDAAITASVNAALAKDPELSALSINVDTKDGNVALKGKAPSSTARDRATQLASAVNGVRSVDNQLSIEPRS